VKLVATVVVAGISVMSLLLSFSTPLAPLADALVGMFDAIAATLRWIP